jgi:putative glutamine amidotransferase
MLPGYMRVIEECGGVPIMLPLTTDKDELEQVYNLCDGILFTGGHDVSPKVYGEEKKETEAQSFSFSF